MHHLHAIINRLFAKHPKIREFCFLSLPLAFCDKGISGLYNAQAWLDYFASHQNILKLLPCDIDATSRKNVKTLLARRKTLRHFLYPTEILRYYQAKHLTIPYWFPNDGTLLKSVFLFKAGINYIPHRHQTTLRNRIAIDGGAASGDSSIVLIECGASQVFAFEPSPRQREEMVKVFSRNQFSDRIKIVPHAIGEHAGTVFFNDQYGDRIEATALSIDSFCHDMDVGCIKLDIEGAEFPAMLNAEKTIERCHPILLICAYHRPEDLFEMPRWLQHRFPFYKIILRDTEPGNRGVGIHLCMIAWPEDN